MNRQASIVLSGAAVLLALAANVHGARITSGTATVMIYTAKDDGTKLAVPRACLEVTGADADCRDLQTDSPAVIDLDRGESVSVVIADANPLLYAYRWKGQERAMTSNAQAAKGLAEGLSGFLGALGPATPVAGRTLQEKGALASALGNKQARSASEQILLEELRKDLLVERIALAAGIDQARAFAERLSSTIGRLEQALADLDGLCKRSDDDFSSIRVSLAEWKVDELVKEIRDGLEKLRAADKLLDASIRAGELTQTDLLSTYFGSILFRFLARETQIRAGLETLTAFRDVAVRVGQPIELGRITYDEAHAQPGLVEITALDKNPFSDHKGRLAGKSYPLRFEPRSSLVLGVGAAAIYSFVRDPSYEAAASGDTFRIVDTNDSDYTGLNLGVLLTLTPRQWMRNDVYGQFELGVSPKDPLGLFAGLGMRFLSFASVGGGVAFERVRKLGPGLSEGGPLARKEDLLVKKRFRPGFYLHLTVSVSVN